MPLAEPPSSPAAIGVLLSRALPDCAEAVIAELAPLFHRRDVAKGAGLLAQGQIWRDALLVERGLLRLYFVRHDGREFNKNFFADGALFFPLTPAMWSDASLFAIGALDAGLVWHADSASIRRCLETHGLWHVTRGRMLERLITHKLQREHDLLTPDGRRRYEAFRRREPLLAERVPLNQLASYLGLTDVSLSRIRRQEV
ncbi:MAG: Crp/Fnr family transcriptional regulator [Rubrivivax sp.]|nr:Crp/Fnr family transcriptional regulator [Rubrivivax sp.]